MRFDEKPPRRRKSTIAGSERVEFGYDSAALLTKKEISSKLGIEAITAYEYAKNGNLKKKVDFYGIHSKTETYTYTAFGELKTAEGRYTCQRKQCQHIYEIVRLKGRHNTQFKDIKI